MSKFTIAPNINIYDFYKNIIKTKQYDYTDLQKLLGVNYSDTMEDSPYDDSGLWNILHRLCQQAAKYYFSNENEAIFTVYVGTPSNVNDMLIDLNSWMKSSGFSNFSYNNKDSNGFTLYLSHIPNGFIYTNPDINMYKKVVEMVDSNVVVIGPFEVTEYDTSFNICKEVDIIISSLQDNFMEKARTASNLTEVYYVHQINKSELDKNKISDLVVKWLIDSGFVDAKWSIVDKNLTKFSAA